MTADSSQAARRTSLAWERSALSMAVLTALVGHSLFTSGYSELRVATVSYLVVSTASTAACGRLRGVHGAPATARAGGDPGRSRIVLLTCMTQVAAILLSMVLVLEPFVR